MRKILFFKFLLLSFLMGVTSLHAQTGNVVWELFKPQVGTGNNEEKITQLREGGDSFTATCSKEIDQLYFGSKNDAANNGGTTYSDIDHPDFKGKDDVGDYQSRVRGYFFVTKAAKYQFLMASDDGAQFWMNPEGTAQEGMIEIVKNNQYTGDWNGSQVKDAGRTLQPGIYAFIITHEEGSGGDFVKLGVKVDDAEAVIVGKEGSNIVLSQVAQSIVTPSLVAVPAAVQQGQTGILYGIALEVAQAPLKISGVSLKTNGTVEAGDITKYSLYFNASAPSLAGATLLAEKDALSGGIFEASGLTAEIASGSTGYLLLAGAVADGAVIDRTIGIDAIADLSTAITASNALYDPAGLAAGSAVKFVQKTDAQSTIGIATFTYPENIDYKQYTEAYLPIAKFKLSDAGDDGKATIINNLTVELGNWQNIASVAIYDGNTLLKETPVTGASSALSGLTLTAASKASKEFDVAVKFKKVVADRAVISVKIAEAIADALNSQLAADGLSGAVTTLSGDQNKIQVTAIALSFQTQPAADGIYGTPLTRQPVVQSVDANGSVDTDVNGKTVTLANSASAIMTNNTANLTNGTATFSGFAIQHPTAVTITASADGLTSVTSDEIALVSNVYTKDNDWAYIGSQPIGQGALNAEVARLIYQSKATAEAPVTLTGFVLTSGNSTSPADIDSASVYYNGALFGTGLNDGAGKFVLNSSEGVTFNSEGDKEFKIVVHVSPDAVAGNRVDAILESMVVDGNTIPARENINQNARTIMGAMSGEYYVDLNATSDLFNDGGRNFNSFGEAMNQLYQRGAAVPGVTIIVKDDQEFDVSKDQPLRLYNIGKKDAPVVIKRSEDGTDRPHIKVGMGNDYYVKMLLLRNCQYITIDGLFLDCYRAEGTNPMAGIVIGNDLIPSENIIIQNCKISINQELVDRSACIGIRYLNFNFQAEASNNGMTLKDCKFLNNEIVNCAEGIHLEIVDNVEISGNTISDFTYGGIYVNNVTNSQISGNTIKDTEFNEYPNPGASYVGADRRSAIHITGMNDDVVISGNMIYNLINNLNTQTYKQDFVTGIYAAISSASTSRNNAIFNNMIWDLGAPNSNVSNNEYAVTGIQVDGSGAAEGGFIGVYNNSVSLNATSPKKVIAFNAVSGARPLLQNNIFVNNGTSEMGVYAVNIDPSRLEAGSDNNIYYAGVPSDKNFINANGSKQTLAEYQEQVTGKEVATTSQNITFMGGPNALNVADDGSRAYVIGKGVSVAGITTDIWGISRDPSTPTIGAWEVPPVRNFTIIGGTSDPNTNKVDEGSIVTITADAPVEGKEFDKWEAEGVILADETKAETTFKVPGNDVTVKSTYKDVIYTITVTGGGYADYSTAIFKDNITLTAPEITGKRFLGWNGEDRNTLLSDTTLASVSFQMPSHNVEFESVYEDIVYNIALENASSEKSTAIYKESVTITADAPELGMMFDKWEGDVDVLAPGDLNKSEVTISMPAKNISLKATYVIGVYGVYVSGGTSNKPDGANYNDDITITADEPEEGMKFTGWAGSEEDLALVTDVTNPTISFKMPDRDVYLSATYEAVEYTITVDGGTATFDKATMNTTVRVTARKPAWEEMLVFDHWESDDVTFSNPKSESTIFDMPAKDVVIKAVFVEGDNAIGDEELANVVVYPNPAADYIQVRGLNEDSNYTIVNAGGQIVLSGSDYNGEAIDISALASGTYFFRVDDKTFTFMKK
ncbi:MAG: T9SS type A sorting domain-containing protein [Bacteroidales bacterium]|nr:T9SS type A sorting domain-containing protein [Bacteroidales bacterium]